MLYKNITSINHILGYANNKGGWVFCGTFPLIAALLSACAPAPAAFPLPVERRSAQQQVELSVRGQTYRFNDVAQSSTNSLSLIALGPLNARLFTLRYDGQSLVLEKRLGAPERLDAARVLSDFQLIFLPLAELQTHAQLNVGEAAPGTREVLRNGHAYAQIQYGPGAPWNGRSTLINRSPGYQLTVDSIEILE